jgi:hypothetical protein
MWKRFSVHTCDTLREEDDSSRMSEVELRTSVLEEILMEDRRRTVVDGRMGEWEDGRKEEEAGCVGIGDE